MMKRVLLCGAVLPALMGVAGVAVAAPIEGSVWGSASAQSALTWRGMDLSDRQASIGLGGGIKHDGGAYLVGNLNTVKLPNAQGGYPSGTQLMLDTTVGYLADVGYGISAGVAYTDYRFGGSGAGAYDFGEVGVMAAWEGLSATYAYTVEGNTYRVPGMTQGDRYLELGYMHQLGAWSVGGAAGYAWYADAGTEPGWRQVSLKGVYQVSHNFDLMGSIQVGGHDANKRDWGHNNRLVLGGRYLF